MVDVISAPALIEGRTKASNTKRIVILAPRWRIPESIFDTRVKPVDIDSGERWSDRDSLLDGAPLKFQQDF
ncbi:hypothetical protein [Marinobacter changyiensis]|uniref:hypothetical protein n=1 Tax=Marinobacter changyiensis TaxID=2604091 RepID=UPI0012644624|nr:hypothetical protein [Marinobacter changyiensis]